MESDWYKINFGSEFCKTHEYAAEGFWELEKVKFKPSFLQLKTVRVVGINKDISNSELENALSLLKFLLEKSSLLENLTISVGKFKLEPEFLNFSQRLSSFEKSSPNSVILFP